MGGNRAPPWGKTLAAAGQTRTGNRYRMAGAKERLSRGRSRSTCRVVVASGKWSRTSGGAKRPAAISLTVRLSRSGGSTLISSSNVRIAIATEGMARLRGLARAEAALPFPHDRLQSRQTAKKYRSGLRVSDRQRVWPDHEAFIAPDAEQNNGAVPQVFRVRYLNTGKIALDPAQSRIVNDTADSVVKGPDARVLPVLCSRQIQLDIFPKGSSDP